MSVKIKVITPAGPLYVDSIREARDYKDLYGYPYVVVRNKENQP